ncbi:hypothetical protein chiPu_0003996 [Chiloscyllium punctatum]|uniref:Insulin-like domain-containing protein n=1 Tax=Chiloscyllium punctatum TaxID=137246 RepID=A0A401S5C3_CHIPU|nr:hypothetical protein [Chiloscyllium punctatum]
MECLVSILAIVLLLTSLTGSEKANGINLDEKFTNLCGYKYVRKIYEICGGWPWKAILPQRFDPFQASGDNSNSKETIKTNVCKRDVNRGRRRREGSYDHHDVYDEANPYEPMPDDSPDHVPDPNSVSKILTAFSKTDIRTKLMEGPLSKKCCKTGCTTRAMHQLC